MYFPTSVLPTEPRISEIDNRIEELSRIIDTITGYERSFFNTKLLNVKLKKQRMLALSQVAQTQTMQRVLAEIDTLVAENDLNLEIDSIKNASEKLMRRKRRRNDDSQDSQQGNSFSIQTTQENPQQASSNQQFVGKFNIQDIPRRQESTSFVTNQAIQPDLLSCRFTPIGKAPSFTRNSNTKSAFVPISTPTIEVENIIMDEGQNNATALTKLTYHNDTADTLLLTCEDNKSSASIQFAREMEAATTTATEEKLSHRKNKTTHVNPVKLAEKIKNLDSNTVDTNARKCVNGKETREEIGRGTKSGTHEDILNLFRSYKSIMGISETSALKRPRTSLSSDELLAKKVCNSSDDSSKNSMRSKNFNGEQTTVNINITKSIKTSRCNDVTAKNSKKSLNFQEPCTVDKKLADGKKENSKRSRKRSRKSKDYKTTGNIDKEHNTPKDLSRFSLKPVETERLTGNLKDANAISYIDKSVQRPFSAESSKTEDVSKSMEENAYHISSNEDIVNSLFRDLMASKRIQLDRCSSSDKTATCFQCGQVNQGHMCVYTIRELLEHC